MSGVFIVSVVYLVVVTFPTTSDGFVVNTNREGNPYQAYNPVSAEQQGGSPNFQQPNVLTAQKVQIQSATSKPVFGVLFGQQMMQQPTQCIPTRPNLQVPSGASQELFDYYNQLHATAQPFPKQQQQQLQYGQGINYGSDHYGQNGNDNNPPPNPIQQVTGTSGPLQVFQKPDYVPLSMQLTSQQGRPVYVSSHNQRPQEQQPGNPSLGSLYANQNGQKPPSGSSGQQQPAPYNHVTTKRPRSGPIGYQPINIGKRSVRVKRASLSRFDSDTINSPSTSNQQPMGYKQGVYQGAPSYFTDPFKYQMDQSKNPLPQSSGSRDQGVLVFADPSSFFGGSSSSHGTTQNSKTTTTDEGTQTDNSSSRPKINSSQGNIYSTSSKDIDKIKVGQDIIDSVSSSTLAQGGSVGKQGAINQGSLKPSSLSPDVQDTTMSQHETPTQEVTKFDPNKVNQASFNFFDPSAMFSMGRGKRRSLYRRDAQFDPSKMNAGSFQPSQMAAGSYDPNIANSANSAKNQNPASHPPGHFDPSSMLSGSYNPGQGNAGQANPGSVQKPTATQTPPGQLGVGTQTGQNPNPSTGQQTGGGQNSGQPLPGPYDPSKPSNGSSFVPGSNGLFDPSAWSAFIGKK